MSNQTPTRRTFLKGGALLAVPALASAAGASAAGTSAAPSTGAAAPAGEAAIRALHQAWLRRIDSGYRDPLLEPAVRRISADPAGEADRIELAADGRSATGRYDCVVELETAVPAGSTLAQMAQVQGHGSVSRTRRRRLQVDYTLDGGRWEMLRARFRTA